MPEIDPQIGRRIADCARAVNIAKATMDRARTHEERLQCQAALERAEAEMNDAAMQINRGVSRVAPAP